ncbi:MAG TPA: nuclear transport factor 2 family protein [Allosphingosinicella sp.]|nr:nuclear transport factor 2 family protein [Allosphingosinicella sp.]
MIRVQLAAAGLLLALAAPAAAEETGTTGVAAQIRALRAQSNAAIAAHDFEGMRRFFVDDYTILPGSSGASFDIEAFRRRIVPTFADPTFVTYVRTPIRIIVGRSGKRAAETGRWVGTWRTPQGEMRLSGIYQAMWVPTPAGWRLKNESFVSLACAGGARCTELD